jgi:hypothetical protein
VSNAPVYHHDDFSILAGSLDTSGDGTLDSSWPLEIGR